jgi:hypothetical protein
MYSIHFVGDGELPEGHDFLFLETTDGALFFLRESALSPRLLEDSWAAYRASCAPGQCELANSQAGLALASSH